MSHQISFVVRGILLIINISSIVASFKIKNKNAADILRFIGIASAIIAYIIRYISD